MTCDCGNCGVCARCASQRDDAPVDYADNLDGELHPTLRDEVINELAALSREFPLDPGIKRIAIVSRIPGGKQNSDGWFGDAGEDGTLWLNERAFGASGEGKDALIARLVEGNEAPYLGGKRRFHGGMDSVGSVIAHEFGHFVATEVMGDPAFGRSLASLQRSAWMVARRMDRGPTRYSLENEDEYCAEAFATLRHGDEEALSAPGVVDLGALLDAYFRR